MSILFEYRDVLQHILQYMTNGVFTLDVSEKHTAITHDLINLRATCSVARKLIPQPVKMNPTSLFVVGIETNNNSLCEIAKQTGNIQYDIIIHHGLTHQNFKIIENVYNTFPKLLEKMQYLHTVLYLAAYHNRFDICSNLCDFKNNQYMFYYIIFGAAKGGHRNIIDFVRKTYHGTKYYDAQLGGALEGEQFELYEDAINNMRYELYVINASQYEFNIIEKTAATTNIKFCTILRKFVKEQGHIDTIFYETMMKSAIIHENENLILQVCQWTKEDNFILNYTSLLQHMINNIIKQCKDWTPQRIRVYNLIHDLSKRCRQIINYNLIIECIRDQQIFIHEIKQLALDNEYDISDICNEQESVARTTFVPEKSDIFTGGPNTTRIDDYIAKQYLYNEIDNPEFTITTPDISDASDIDEIVISDEDV